MTLLYISDLGVAPDSSLGGFGPPPVPLLMCLLAYAWVLEDHLHVDSWRDPFVLWAVARSTRPFPCGVLRKAFPPSFLHRSRLLTRPFASPCDASIVNSANLAGLICF